MKQVSVNLEQELRELLAKMEAVEEAQNGISSGVVVTLCPSFGHCGGHGGSGVCGVDVEQELRSLLAKAEQKQVSVCPCPVCGGEMLRVQYTHDTICPNPNCPYIGTDIFEVHNAICRVIEAGVGVARGGSVYPLKNAVENLREIRKQYQREAE
jgi:hypothetical protein